MTAYYGRFDGKTGKRSIVFKKDQSLTGKPIQLPCGQCVGCRLERSRQWAMRCMHEKRLHRDSCFVTLTYDNDCLPPGGSLVKRDFQLFMKKLRKARGKGIRYYMCGEYGDLNKRPHYHAIYFGLDFADKKVAGQNGRGDVYYESAQLSGLWGLGRCMLGDVTFDSAAYVARYVMKKVTGEKAAAHYEVMDADGVVYDRLPEYTDMSRGGRSGLGGIGKGYYEKYGSEVRAHDSVIVNGRDVRPPRFYDGLTEAVDPKRYAAIKRRRRVMAKLLAGDNTRDRLRVKEILTLKRLEQKKRNI